MNVSLPPPLEEDAHKGDAGRLLVLAGSAPMPGAAILCCRAAQRGGAGLVTLVADSDEHELARAVAPASPETVHAALDGASFEAFLSERIDRAAVAGPGLGIGATTRAHVEALVARFDGPIGFDADALTVVAGEPERFAGRAAPTVLTPHPGEAARLLGRGVPPDDDGRAACARELARRAGAIVCLKGAGTVVTDGERLVVNATGNPGMATAGAGDVLLGLLGAYLCGLGPEYDAFDAAVAAVHVHGLAGDLAAADLGRRAVCASDLVDFLPVAQCLVESSASEDGE